MKILIAFVLGVAVGMFTILLMGTMFVRKERWWEDGKEE